MIHAAGCAITGTGSGTIGSDSRDVHFSWRTFDRLSGTMTATVSGGRVFSGEFIRLTGETPADSLDELWKGWGPRWYPLWRRNWSESEWSFWHKGPEFVRNHAGFVVANLADPTGKHMRCIFQLAHPPEGMAGGGYGRCQGPDRRTIDASFPAS
jgi:hypothetical protein